MGTSSKIHRTAHFRCGDWGVSGAIACSAEHTAVPHVDHDESFTGGMAPICSWQDSWRRPKIITSQGWNTVAPVAAHSPVHITVEATAPHEPGRYISYFRLFDPVSGLPFGDRIWLDMTVSGPPSDTDWDMLHGDGKTNQ